MAGGDLKGALTDAMASPFNPPFSKGQALGWAMQVAEAMHYLHAVCRPMIIHRDLKLDNVLLTGGPMHHRVVRALGCACVRVLRVLRVCAACCVLRACVAEQGGVLLPCASRASAARAPCTATTHKHTTPHHTGLPARAHTHTHTHKHTHTHTKTHTHTHTHTRTHSQAKLADFGLHKRVRRVAASGALVAWDQEVTYHGDQFEKSYYGGRLYLHKSAMSVAGSSVAGDDSSAHGSSHYSSSLHGGSMHGANGASAQLAASSAAAPGGGGNQAGPDGPAGVAAAADGGGGGGRSGSAARPPLPRSGSKGMLQLDALHEAPEASGAAWQPGAPVADSLASLRRTSSSAGGGASAAGLAQPTSQQYEAMREQQEQLLLLGAVRARSEAPSQKRQGMARTMAAVQALEGSVRAGSAYFQAPPAGDAAAAQAAARDGAHAAAATDSQHAPGGAGGVFKRGKRSCELCPELVQQVQVGLAAAAAAGSTTGRAQQQQQQQQFIEATQKVGSVLYMAPEVLTGARVRGARSADAASTARACAAPPRPQPVLLAPRPPPSPPPPTHTPHTHTHPACTQGTSTMRRWTCSALASSCTSSWPAWCSATASRWRASTTSCSTMRARWLRGTARRCRRTGPRRCAS
jgi:serine/threonine protein kinase